MLIFDHVCRYQKLTDELQVERDSLQAIVASSEVQLQQQSDEIQRLHDKVTVQHAVM